MWNLLDQAVLIAFGACIAPPNGGSGSGPGGGVGGGFGGFGGGRFGGGGASGVW